EIEAAAAAVTDVEDAPHLGIELHRIGEIRILPSDDVAGGGVETAFAGHANSSNKPRPASPSCAKHIGRGGARSWRGAKRRLSQRRAEGFTYQGHPALSGSGRHGTSRPWPGSRTSRRFRQSLPSGRSWPCPDTCRYIRGSRRRWRP